MTSRPSLQSEFQTASSTQTNTVLKKETTSKKHKLLQDRNLTVISVYTEKSARVLIKSLKGPQTEGSFLKIGKKTNNKVQP